jgi:predicted TIM-barrel fold metal-dependent hydrolase
MSTEREPTALERDLEALELVDHHCHGVVTTELDRAGFEDLISESFDPAPPGTSHFETPVGVAIRRWCAPVLDLPPFADAEAYLTRREELGAGEVNRRLLRASGLSALLVETGYRSADVADPGAMASLAGAPAHEVVRLEAVAEAVADTAPSAQGYAEAFAEALHLSAREAVGLKTIVAYRGGFAFDPSPPSDAEVESAAGRWLRAREAHGARLEDATLLRFGIWTGAQLARRSGLPLQVHTGYGDPDITLHLTNPSLLTDLVKGLGRLGVNVVFLHCYPYQREAAYLAAVLPNVYLDVGEAITYTGASSWRVLAEAMELAPFTKHLYSSDAFGVAELYHLGSVMFRRGMARVLGGWVDDDACSREEALRIASLVGRENAMRLYQLGGS